MLAKIKRLFASRRAPWVIALLAVLLGLPTLGLGLMIDDYAHRMMMDPPFSRPGGLRGDWDLFRVVDGSPEAWRFSLDHGLFPWWTTPSFKISLFRPLASLWHAVDYRLWPDWPGLMHAETLLAYGAAVLLAGLFYRRVLGATACAGLAALLFAIDDAHAFLVTWIANRNALLSGAFVFAALIAYDRARRDAWRPGLFLGPLLFAAGLLSGETGLGGLAYLGAYALFLDRAALRDRALALAPYAAVTLAWLVVYRALGSGAEGSSFYIDPSHRPIAYLGALVVRLPVLLAAQLAGPPADVMTFVPEDKHAQMLLVALPVLLFVGAGLVVALRKDRRAAFFATGMVLSLLPVCATAPNDRLLLLSGFGAFGLVASLLAASREGLRRASRILVGAVAAVFVLLHLVVAPVLLPLRAYALGKMIHGYVERTMVSLPEGAALSGKTLVAVNAPDPLVLINALSGRYTESRVFPSRVRILSVVLRGDATIKRVDARTLSVTVMEGYYHDSVSMLFREGSPHSVGDKIEVEGMVAEVKSIAPESGRPRRVDFTFDRPLEDASFTWITWGETSFVPFPLPAVGEERRLPPIDVSKAFDAAKTFDG